MLKYSFGHLKCQFFMDAVNLSRLHRETVKARSAGLLEV